MQYTSQNYKQDTFNPSSYQGTLSLSFSSSSP